MHNGREVAVGAWVGSNQKVDRNNAVGSLSYKHSGDMEKLPRLEISNAKLRSFKRKVTFAGCGTGKLPLFH